MLEWFTSWETINAVLGLAALVIAARIWQQSTKRRRNARLVRQERLRSTGS